VDKFCSVIVLYFNVLESPGNAIGLTRKEIFLLMRDHLNDNVIVAYKIVENQMSNKLQYSFTLPEDVKPIIRKLLHDFKRKWQQVQRKQQKFLYNFDDWLNVFVSFKNIKQVLETPKKNGSTFFRIYKF
jgi:hypothetical protein